MYIEKRWLVPAALSLLLLGALVAIALLVRGSRVPDAVPSVRAAGITSADRQSPAREAPETSSSGASRAPSTTEVPASPLVAPEPAPPADVVPTARVTPATSPTPEAAEVPPAIPQPEEVVDIATLDSDGTQINTRGFGDISMQFQDVHINAPITNVHISNQGNNNSTNVNIGDHDKIVSEQEHLQSNRRDAGSPPPATQDGRSDAEPPAERGLRDQGSAESPPARR